LSKSCRPFVKCSLGPSVQNAGYIPPHDGWEWLPDGGHSLEKPIKSTNRVKDTVASQTTLPALAGSLSGTSCEVFFHLYTFAAPNPDGHLTAMFNLKMKSLLTLDVILATVDDRVECMCVQPLFSHLDH
jgi:hypothetical protein